jgi:AraC family transcriptional regulator
VLLLRELPRLGAAGWAARHDFYAKWGRDVCIVSAHASASDYAAHTHCLSIKACWGGSERYFLGRRSIAVDDDHYLTLNEGRRYGSALANDRPAHTFSIFFRPGSAQQALGGLLTPGDRALARETEEPDRPVEFAEMLRPHDRLVTPVLRFIAQQVERGVDDELWYEEQLSFLLERMLRAHRRSLVDAFDLDAARVGTRLEIYRRIALSVDYINTWYMRPVSIAELSGAAHLSKFHFLRMFKAVHGMTPHAYLQRKRASVARRLMASTRLGHPEIASAAGFDHRSTMYRQLRRWAGGAALPRC